MPFSGKDQFMNRTASYTIQQDHKVVNHAFSSGAVVASRLVYPMTERFAGDLRSNRSLRDSFCCCSLGRLGGLLMNIPDPPGESALWKHNPPGWTANILADILFRRIQNY